MNAEGLLAHYERIADAPDALTRLREFLLDLAVRGWLVPQQPTDEPASELLQRIAAERARLIHERKIRHDKQSHPIAGDECLSGVPKGWERIRLGDVIRLVSGQHLQPSEYSNNSESGLPYITGPSDFTSDGLRITRFALAKKATATKGQLLLTVKGSGVGTTAICDLPEVAISRQLMALTAIAWDSRYLTLVTHRLAEKLQEQARSLIPGISREDVENFVFPFPPLLEQHRIVAKVDELMALCDRLQAARERREATRDRLAAASFARLNSPDPETFRDDARFALDTLPALTARADQVKQLRQTILNLAVRGKLVPQDPNYEPASNLLTLIAAEKARLIDEKKLKRQRQLAPIAVENTPFPLPAGWVWSKADDVFLNITDGFHNTPSPVAEGYPYLTAKHIRPNRIDFENCLFVDEKNHRELYTKTRVKRGDILIVNIGAGCGTPAMIDVDFEFSFKNVAVVNLPSRLDRNFVLLFLLYYRDLVFDELIKGGAQPFLSLAMLREMLVPLPPLAEQHRIVAKVDELMALCDRLEAGLATAAKTRSSLLDALLAEALEPAERDIDEAA